VALRRRILQSSTAATQGVHRLVLIVSPFREDDCWGYLTPRIENGRSSPVIGTRHTTPPPLHWLAGSLTIAYQADVP
jgi:hypothetical protein